MPTLAIGGGISWGRGQEVARPLRQMAVDVTEEVYRECGHWAPEEKPVQLAAPRSTSAHSPDTGRSRPRPLSRVGQRRSTELVEPVWEPESVNGRGSSRPTDLISSRIPAVGCADRDGLECLMETYGSGGLRRSRSVSKYTDRLIRARVAAAMAPAHQYQPPSVTPATIKPAASTTSVLASPSRHHRGNPELTL